MEMIMRHHFRASVEGGEGFIIIFIIYHLSWGLISFRFRFRIIYTIFKQMFLKSLYNLLFLTKMFESIKNVLKKTVFLLFIV